MKKVKGRFWPLCLVVILFSACMSPLDSPRPIITITASANTPQVTESPTMVFTETVVPPTEPGNQVLEINNNLLVLNCSCGHIRKIMLTIEPVGGVGPYSFSVEPYPQIYTFDDTQSFEVNPGSILTIHIYSSDSKMATKQISIPDTCGIASNCSNDPLNNFGVPSTQIPPTKVVVCIPKSNTNKC